MNRSITFALILAFGQSSVAFAGETLIASATRVVRETTAQPVSTLTVQSRTSAPLVTIAARTGVRESSSTSDVLAQAQGGAVSQSGMGKKTKWMIYLGVAAAFVGTAYAIDHSVTDVTPSTLGTRQD